ncbi:methylenetetrahydrofolate reductase [Chloroflexi bacterium]|nr:methylenetetrahydrofolate reductase [Chloroflexota bacterium]
MNNLLEVINRKGKRPFVLCDYSPPKGGHVDLLSEANEITPDMFMVAYAPGNSVRVNPIFVADWIQSQTNIPSMFTISTRDANKSAIQSLLLGAELKDLHSLLIVAGDKFTSEHINLQSEVNDFKPTELIGSIKAMNERRDYQGKALIYPTRFCVGAALDLSRNWNDEIRLTKLKVDQGCDFMISQPVFDVELPQRFLSFYKDCIGENLNIPILWGIQMVEKNTVSFAEVPKWLSQELEDGRLAHEITIDLIMRYIEVGIDTFYLVPTIFKGGRRDYFSAQAVIEELE